DKARQHRVTSEIECLRVVRNCCGSRRSDCSDLAAVDDDGLVILSRCSSAVDYANMQQGDPRRFNANKLLAFIALRLRKRVCKADDQKENNENWLHKLFSIETSIES